MLRTIIALPDGTEISSGPGTVNAIQNSTLTECVNSGEDLTIGSTCANALEATLITPAGGLSLSAGTEIIAYKDDGTTRTKVGTFIPEKPTRPTANTMKITGYDRVSKLDKDLTAWLSGLKEWPYTLTTFAGMVCGVCGLTFKASDVPNGDFLVYQFSRSSVTGRQLMQWLGEICCRFCRATPSGEIEFAWYTDSGKTITTGGDLYYFQNGLSYEDYQTAVIDAVQIRLADSENGALWPEAAEGANSYIITGNPILNLRITEDLEPVLANIKAELAGIRYTPCKVSVPANLDIRAGNTVRITDKNGKTITAYVMTKTQTGQKDTLESTGNRRRDTATAANTKPQSQAAESAAANAFAGMTADQMFNKLTNNGEIQGLLRDADGNLYTNAEYIVALEKLFAKNITMTGKFESEVDACLPPTYNDALYLQWHLFFPNDYPLPEGYDFDLNGDGVFDVNDAIMAMKVYNGELSMKDCPGAAKTKATLRIDMSNPDKAIHLFGTNMWGTYIETFISVDINNGSFASREYLKRMINLEENGDSLYRTVDGEREYFNPPMSEGEEYRTTERHYGNPVYAKLVNCNGMPGANGTKVIVHGCSNIRAIVGFSGYMSTPDNSPIALPYHFSDTNLAHLSVDYKNITIVTGATDLSSYTTAMVWLKYTKI